MVESVTLEPYQILPETDTSLEPADAPNLSGDKNVISHTGAYGGCCGGCGSGDGIAGAWREPASTANGGNNEP
jgi:hypothetical protein